MMLFPKCRGYVGLSVTRPRIAMEEVRHHFAFAPATTSSPASTRRRRHATAVGWSKDDSAGSATRAIQAAKDELDREAAAAGTNPGNTQQAVEAARAAARAAMESLREGVSAEGRGVADDGLFGSREVQGKKMLVIRKAIVVKAIVVVLVESVPLPTYSTSSSCTLVPQQL